VGDIITSLHMYRENESQGERANKKKKIVVMSDCCE
jgi:hypothetical protein